jgi:hypothetical protein
MWSGLPIGVAATTVWHAWCISRISVEQVSASAKEQLPMEDLDAKEDLSYQGYPVKIIEASEKVTWNKKIKMCKVQWSHHTEEEATWEREEELKAQFPSFFSDLSESRGRDSF